MRIWDIAQPLCSGVVWEVWGAASQELQGSQGGSRHWSSSLQSLCHTGLGSQPAQQLLPSALLPHLGLGGSFPGVGLSRAVSPCSLTEALLPSAERSVISWLVNVMNSCTLWGHSTGPGDSAGHNQLPHSSLLHWGNKFFPSPSPHTWAVVGFPRGRGWTPKL